MSTHGFKSVFMVASVAGAALGCYLVSLNVASERAKLEQVESEIVLAQRDIRVLQTEIGTRGRLAQLERWNAGFIRLSAPTADQFLEGGFQLATMVKPAPKSAIEAPIVLASAPAAQGVGRQPSTSDSDEPKPGATTRLPPRSAQDMMHVASYERQTPKPTANAFPTSAKPVAQKSITVKPTAVKGTNVATTDALAPLSGPTKESGTPQ